MNRRRARIFRNAVAFVMTIAVPLLSNAQATHDDPAKEFESRVANYLQVRQTAIAAHPKSTGSVGKLDAQQDDLAENVRAARPQARQGDIFSPDIAAYFRGQIAATLNGLKGPHIKATLRHAEPVKMPIQVNKKYPQGVPLQSMPPTLLLNLPPLPAKELEYRIVGSDLVLRDVGANMVVDFVPNIFPKL